MNIHEYLRALKEALRSREVVAPDLVREMAEHLNDTYRQEIAAGAGVAEAH